MSSKETHSGPRRRCVICRSPGDKRSFLRFVAGPEGELIFDVRQRAPGRGVSLCTRERCVKAAFAGGLRRGFKGAPVTIPEDFLRDVVRPALSRVYGELLSVAYQSGQLIAGSETVERASKEGTLEAYMLAADASPGTRRKFEENARRKGMSVLGLWGRQEIGQQIGREEAVVLGWRAGALHDHLKEVEAQLKALSAF